MLLLATSGYQEVQGAELEFMRDSGGPGGIRTHENKS